MIPRRQLFRLSRGQVVYNKVYCDQLGRRRAQCRYGSTASKDSLPQQGAHHDTAITNDPTNHETGLDAFRKVNIDVPEPLIEPSFYVNKDPFGHKAASLAEITLDQIHRRMNYSIRKGNYSQVYQLAKLVKSRDMQPTTTTYNLVLRAMASAPDGLLTENCFRLVDEMKTRQIYISPETFSILFKAISKSSNAVCRAELLDMVKSYWYTMTKSDYESLIRSYTSCGEIENAVAMFEECCRSGVLPDTSLFMHVSQHILYTTYDAGFVLDFLNALPDQLRSIVPVAIWANTLSYAANGFDLQTVEACWQSIVRSGIVEVDNGTLLSILMVAGRFGKADLAQEVFDVIKAQHMAINDIVLAPLIEAYTRDGSGTPEAFKLAASDMDYGFQLNLDDLDPLCEALRVPGPYKVCLEAFTEMCSEGKKSITAFNVLLRAGFGRAIILNESETFLSTLDLFLTLGPDHGIVPDRQSFTLVIKAIQNRKGPKLDREAIKQSVFSAFEKLTGQSIDMSWTKQQVRDAVSSAVFPS